MTLRSTAPNQSYSLQAYTEHRRHLPSKSYKGLYEADREDSSVLHLHFSGDFDSQVHLVPQIAVPR
jgi:hypothetical protein